MSSLASRLPTEARARLLPLRPAVQHYAWGSREALPELLGEPPDGRPWAEAWFGAHPAAPSTLSDGTPLDAVLEREPSLLGPEGQHTHLPFLVKLLAAAEPLSLQSHPSEEQARLGWQREEAAGVALDARHRSYRDPHPKPEAVLALTEFLALCGWREVTDLADWLGCLGVAELQDLLRPLLTADDDGERRCDAVRELLSLPAEQRERLTAAVAEALPTVQDPRRALDVEVLGAIVARYPGDAGVLVAQLLAPHRLQPLQSLFVPPGCPHSYVSGVAAEVMTSSDNVLRGGLTPKHVDVPELVRTLDGRATVVPTAGFAVPAAVGFAPSLLELDADLHPDAVLPAAVGASLLLVLDGELTVETGNVSSPGTGESGDHGDGERHTLRRGQAVLVPHAVGPVTVRGGGSLLRVITTAPTGQAADPAADPAASPAVDGAGRGDGA